MRNIKVGFSAKTAEVKKTIIKNPKTIEFRHSIDAEKKMIFFI